MMNNVRKYALIGIALLVVGIAAYNLGRANSQPQIDTETYSYLSKRVLGPNGSDMIINLTALREAMNQHYNDKKTPAGVYFEYLPTGSSIGVNDQYQIEIGSLSKVPAVMAIYRQIEKSALRHTDVLEVKKEHINSQFGDLWKRGAGTRMTVDEFIEYTLVRSDNTAANVLVATLPKGALQEVFNALDLPKTRSGPYPVMSPKSYASVFRTLYLASYLHRDSSQAMLDILTRTIYNDKLPSGVDDKVKVAHKIGVFRIANVQDVYSDCGIVYVPNRPYLLCVMVAADEATAREEITMYSKMAYQYITTAKPAKSASDQL